MITHADRWHINAGGEKCFNFHRLCLETDSTKKSLAHESKLSGRLKTTHQRRKIGRRFNKIVRNEHCDLRRALRDVGRALRDLGRALRSKSSTAVSQSSTVS